MNLSGNPFLIQRMRLRELRDSRRAIKNRLLSIQSNKPVIGLHHKATTREGGEITSEFMISYIENMENQIRNQIPLPLPKNPTEQQQDAIEMIKEDLLPSWISQFKRMMRKALKEGNIELGKLKYYELEFNKIATAFISKDDLNDIETATHTSVPLSLSNNVPLRQRIKTANEKYGLPEVINYPKGTIGRAVQDIQANDDDEGYEADEASSTGKKSDIYSYIIKEADRIGSLAEVEDNDDILKRAAKVEHIAKKYQANQRANPGYQDIAEAKRIQVEFKRLVADHNEQANHEKRTIDTIQGLAESHERCLITYQNLVRKIQPILNFAIMEKKNRQKETPEYAKFNAAVRTIERRINDVGKSLTKRPSSFTANEISDIGEELTLIENGLFALKETSVFLLEYLKNRGGDVQHDDRSTHASDYDESDEEDLLSDEEDEEEEEEPKPKKPAFKVTRTTRRPQTSSAARKSIERTREKEKHTPVNDDDDFDLRTGESALDLIARMANKKHQSNLTPLDLLANEAIKQRKGYDNYDDMPHLTPQRKGEGSNSRKFHVIKF